MSWHRESRRHSLARKGIKTAKGHFMDTDEGKREMREPLHTDPFATGDSLRDYLDSPAGEEYLELHWESLYEVPFNSFEEGIPYWIDHYENLLLEEEVYSREYTDELIEHELGYHDGYEIGEYRTFDGKDYYYVGSVSGGSGELELQADNGDLVYDGIGDSFFRIWKPFPETYISLEEDSYELIHNHKTVAETEKISEMNNPDKALQDLKNRALKNGWKLEPIIWDDAENRFEKQKSIPSYKPDIYEDMFN